MQVYRADLAEIGFMMLPVFGFIILAIVSVHFLQTGFLFTAGPLAPDFSKLNPLKGLSNLFSKNTMFEIAKGVLKIAVLGCILYFTVKKEVVKIPFLIDMEMPGIVNFSFEQLRKLILTAATVLSVFAVVDFAYQKWQFTKNLKMTKMEVKDEAKQSEGDPQIKARIRTLQREMARKRMMQEVPKADVVITNPTHFAVALKYDSSKMGAPTLVAKGANLIAAKIKELAKEHGVPVFEDKPLARTLFKLDLGQEIPETLYRALASILANVYKLKGKKNTSRGL
jgi:flagellar biosynthetic protein FlhB